MTHRGGALFFSQIWAVEARLTRLFNILYFWYILFIFQVLLPDQPERSETNRISKQPIYLPWLFISDRKNAPVRRT